MATTTRSSNIAIDFDLNGVPVTDKVREVKTPVKTGYLGFIY